MSEEDPAASKLYEPPTAAVADVLPDVDLSTRPATVVLACRVLWASLAFAAASSVLEVRYYLLVDQSVPNALLLGYGIASVIGFAIEGTFVYYVLQRANWARWILLGLFVVSWVLVMDAVTDLEPGDIRALYLDGVVTLLEIVASMLLFMGQGRKWFAESH
jgi:hypothetical protein